MTAKTKSGLVISTTGTWNLVYGMDSIYYECGVRGKFRINEGLNATNPVAVGDKVYFELKPNGQRGVIYAIEERDNFLIRQSPKKPSKVHVLAANIDLAIMVFTIDFPRVKPGFLDRFLVTADAYDITPAIVINKNDAYSGKLKEKRDALIALYKNLGYEVYLISAADKKGLSALRDRMEAKKTLVTGPSGVGKSTLLNALYGLRIKTAPISKATSKGKHITTFPRMYPLPKNTFVIDTPGIKEFGLVGFELYEISHFFPEMVNYLDDCKFSNCLHLNEPECAVKKALANGEIQEERYERYKRLLESLSE